jgi:DNA-binding MarR family transcriptional regulator
MKTRAKVAEAQGVEATPYQNRVGFLLGALSNLISNAGARLYRKEFGLGLAEARFVYMLGYETVLTARRASQIIGVDKGAVSRTVATLQTQGLVQVNVDENDTRQRVIRFTQSGKKLHERLIDHALERERQLISVFAEEEAHALSTLLSRLHAHMANVRPPDPLPFPGSPKKPPTGRGQSTRGPRPKSAKR